MCFQLPPRRLAVLPHFSGPCVYETWGAVFVFVFAVVYVALFRGPLDSLVATAVSSADNLVAPTPQLHRYALTHASLELHLSSICHGAPSGLIVASVVPPRCITGLLKAHPKVQQVYQDLYLSLRLHEAAHHTKA